MPIVGVHIEKKFSWRGTDEFFENVYHYDTGSWVETDAGWNELIDDVVTIEKSFHSSEITFTKARIHGPTNTTKADDKMLYIKDLSGTGSGTTATGMPKEMAVVVQLYMGRTQRGYKSFLRKYYHTRHMPNSTGEALAGNAQMAAADRTYFAGKLDSLKTVLVGSNTVDLCKPSGEHIPLATGAYCHPYLHTRQLKQ